MTTKRFHDNVITLLLKYTMVIFHKKEAGID